VVPDEEIHRHFNDVERETHTSSSGTMLLRCAPVKP
jgi:hypothetical protein